MTLESIPSGLYSAVPEERVHALNHTTGEQRTTLMAGLPEWPIMSPGSLNAWLVFIGASPGNSPGDDWNYDPLPSIGGPHPGLSEYEDRNDFWNSTREYARTILPELRPCDAYAATMVRNLVEEQAANAPDGPHMYAAADQAVEVLDKLVRPSLVISLGKARKFTDRTFGKMTTTKHCDSGVLFSSIAANKHKWFSLTGRWETGEAFLYVSPVGIHPSRKQISRDNTLDFLRDQSKVARSLNSSHNEPQKQRTFSGRQSSKRVRRRRDISVTNYDPITVTLEELVTMEFLLSNYTKGLRNDMGSRHGSYQLFSLTAAHGCPSTPEEAEHNAITLARHLLADSTLTFSGHPKLHYAKKSGGMEARYTARRFGGKYHPGRFGEERKELGAAWTLVCASHRTNYESCDWSCRVGIQLKGRFLIDLVRQNWISNG